MAFDKELNEAFRKAVKSYFQEKGTSKLDKVGTRRRKYDKKYFDGVEQSLFGSHTTLNKSNEVKEVSGKSDKDKKETNKNDPWSTNDWKTSVHKPKDVKIREV